jgi:hypothetical protein
MEARCDRSPRNRKMFILDVRRRASVASRVRKERDGGGQEVQMSRKTRREFCGWLDGERRLTVQLGVVVQSMKVLHVDSLRPRGMFRADIRGGHVDVEWRAGRVRTGGDRRWAEA